MEERLMRLLETWVKEGDLTPLKDKLLGIGGSSTSARLEDYWEARNSGLSICEAEFAQVVTGLVRKFGVDGLVSVLEQASSPKEMHKAKRKRRGTRKDQELKKKAKY